MDEAEDAASYWDYLPDEVVCNIFFCLPSKSINACSLVNKRWYELANDPTMLIEYKTSSGMVNDEFLVTLTKKFSRIKNLDLTNCPVSDKGLLAIAHNCPLLESLNLQLTGTMNPAWHSYDGPATGLVQLVQNCRRLTELNLSMNGRLMTDKILEAISAHCVALEKLHLNGISGQAQVHKLVGCRTLRHLWLDQGFGSMYGSLDDKTVSRLVTDMPQMRTLSLARNSALSKITAMAIAKFCTNICHLDFSGTKIKDMTEISSNCPLLEVLLLRNCNVDDGQIVSVSHGCPNLRVLDLFSNYKVTDKILYALAENSPHLQTLNLSYCKRVTNVGVVQLVNSVHLEELSVSCTGVGDAGLLPVIESCPNLKLIRCRGCPISFRVLDSGVEVEYE